MKWGRFTFILLLLYIVVAVIFWTVHLEKQSNIIENYEKQLIHFTEQPFASAVKIKTLEEEISERARARTRQYIGEATALLIFIFFGAYIVYSSLRRQKKFSSLQHNFMLSVTHELKSPIAGIKLNIQTLQRPNLPSDKQSLLLQRSLSEADRLNDLCNNLLLASQMEGKNAIFNKEKFDFSAMCSMAIAEFSNRSHHTLNVDITPELHTIGDEVMWKIVINNLIENAIKYSPAESNIDIKLTAADQQMVFSIADQGPGIDNQEKLKIFNKFYRIGNENSRKTKGTGLGLFLTAAIVKEHNASIVVSNNQPHGSIFEITLDMVNATA